MGIFSKNKNKDKDYLYDISNEEEYTMFGAVSHQEPAHALTAQEVLKSQGDHTTHTSNSGNALNSLKSRMLKASEQTQNPSPTQDKKTPQEKSSLLEKCKPFVTDENGVNASENSAPLYKLESVAEILKSDSQKAIERLSKKYDISFGELGKIESSPKETLQEKAKAKPEKNIMLITEDEPEVFEEKIKFNDNAKNTQSSVPFVISDIDTLASTAPTNPEENSSNTATITFTPINDDDSATAKIYVTHQTRPLDLTGELAVIEDSENKKDLRVELEKNEFEDFVPENECQSEADVKKLLRELSIKKRNSFLCSAFSVILTLILAFAKLPFMTGLLLSQTKVSMIICSVITGIIILLNFNIFKAFAGLFTKKASADIPAALASIAVGIYSVFGILQNEIILDMLLLLGVILSFRAIFCFMKNSYMLSNLRQSALPREKKAVTLISDTAVTFAMAKNAIEGDTLIAAPKRCERICDYMKYSTFGAFLNGKITFISILSVLISLITGVACSAYYDGLLDGLYIAAAIQCLAALPVLFFIDTLPLYSAAKKLNPKKAMIAGKTAAEHIELANALVLNSIDLFPENTVTLHQMKVLAENNIDDTLIRAASLTECLQSPLAPIFKKIAGTGQITTLPDSDTVKYEDKMGISGWVDDRLLFIGNRTLMEAHGIEVPSVEVDRRILRKGYFPVYVATQDTACALLMVQYNVDPEISHELRHLTGLGITLLVNSCDPNLTEEMICDYLGLYNDSVKIMSAAGCHMYRNAVLPENSVSAPACYCGRPITLAKIINCANRIKRSNTALIVFYVLSAILGTVLFAYSSFTVSGALISSLTVLLYTLATSAIAYILYLALKP